LCPPAFKFRASNNPDKVNLTPKLSFKIRKTKLNAYLDEEVVEMKDQVDKYYSLWHQLHFESQVDISMQVQIEFDLLPVSKLLEHQFQVDY
jgi:hypothetical protein